jgi:hypothetical protein
MMGGGFITKIKRAFTWHWNLLAVGAGVGVAFLSGHPDVVLPLVMAVELSYLGFLGLNARFQNVLQGKELLEKAGASAAPGARRLSDLLEFLSPTDQERFARLQERSRVMMQLRKRMSAGEMESDGASYQTGALNKLLWLFLKLLHHKAGLEQFLEHASAPDLVLELERAQARLAEAEKSQRQRRLVDSLREKVDTIEKRIENYRSASENLEMIDVELDKTEQKIAHICEVGMTSRDGSDLSIQIDGITDGIAVSERALKGLRVADLFEEEVPPAFIDGDMETGGEVSLLEFES